MPVELLDPPDWTDLVGARDPTYAEGHFGEIVSPISLRDATEKDVIFLGEPYEGGTLFGAMSTYGRPGSRDGPEAVRKALANTKTYSLHAGEIELSIGDVGDIDHTIMVETPDTAHELIETITRQLHESDAFPVFLGGDHSLAAPNARPLLDLHESVGVINLDSHDDLFDFVREQPHHGSAFKELHTEGLEQYTLLGGRAFGLHDGDYIFDIGGEVISAEAVASEPRAAADRALTTMDGVDAIHVSLDVDVLDAAFALGSNAPYPGGLLPRELFRVVRHLANDPRVVSLDVVECSTRDKEQEIAPTALNAGRAIAHFLSGFQDRSA